MPKRDDPATMLANVELINEAAGYVDKFHEVTPPDQRAVVPKAELEGARAVLAGVVDQAKTDLTLLGKPTVLAAMVMLKKHAPFEYDGLIDRLKAVKGFRLRSLGLAVKGAESNLRLVGQDEREVKTLADYFPIGCPLPELTIPGGYWFSEDATLKFRPQQSPEVIAHGAIVVTGRTEDIEGDVHGVRLSWSRGRGWRHRIVNADVIAEARQLTALAANDFPVTSVDAKEQVTFLAKVKADNYHRLPVKKTASRFGWMGKKGKDGFLIGTQFITPDGEIIETTIDEKAESWDTAGIVFRGNSIGETQIAEGWRPEGNYGDWVNAVSKAATYPVVMATIYASLAAPMLQILGCKNFVFSLDGDTSYGKTSAASAAASVWGNPDVNAAGAAMTTWGTTMYAVERRAAVLRGLPVMLDDTKLAPKTRGEQEIIPKAIYMVASGRAASKGQPGGLRAESLIETVLISTGEIPAVDFSNDGGTRLRVVEVTAMPFGGKSNEIEKTVNHLNREFSANYGHAGPLFVQYLIQNRDKWNKWIDGYRTKIGILIAAAEDAKMGTGKAGRLAAYVAAISQTAEIAHKALALPFTHCDPMPGLWYAIARQAEDPLNAERAFQLVISWCNQHQNRFAGRELDPRTAPAAGWCGKWEHGSDEIFIYPPIVEDLLKTKGYPSADAILRQWRERKWLRTGPDEKRFTVQVRVRGGSTAERVYAIRHPNESETKIADEEV